MRKKIIHVVYGFGVGGLENVIVNLIKHSDPLLVEHCIVSLTNEKSLYTKDLEALASHYSLDKKKGQDLSSHKRFYQLLKKLQPDVVNTYNFGTMEYQVIAALAGINKRVHSDHGYGGDDSSGTSKKRNFIRKMFSKFIHAHIVVSPDLLVWMKNVLNVPENKVSLIYNGIDIDTYFPVQADEQIYTISTVGRADPVKNHALLINAYVKACELNKHFKESSLLKIAGDGPSFDRLEKQKQVLGEEYNIELLGLRRDIDTILKGTDLFVLSSLYEAMPMTILEAMACGVPVVSTNVGGVSNLLSDSEGWLVESQNIEQMASVFIAAFNEPGEAKRRGNNGRKLVEKFYSVSLMVKEYMAIYGIT